jgi:hypothetical protein
MQSSPLPRHLVTVRPKYFPQNSVLKYPQHLKEKESNEKKKSGKCVSGVIKLLLNIYTHFLPLSAHQTFRI